MKFDPPYMAVIFTSQRTDSDEAEYATMAARIDVLAAQQPGYLGIESTRGADGFGITVSYWRDEAAIKNWKQVAEHLGAQTLGKKRFYDMYRVRVARVERAYDFGREDGA